jgi:hypothetical protein
MEVFFGPRWSTGYFMVRFPRHPMKANQFWVKIVACCKFGLKPNR